MFAERKTKNCTKNATKKWLNREVLETFYDRAKL